MWLLISSESENSRFGEFGGDFGEGGATVFPWKKKFNAVQFEKTRSWVVFLIFFAQNLPPSPKRSGQHLHSKMDELKPNVQFHTLLFDIEI